MRTSAHRDAETPFKGLSVIYKSLKLLVPASDAATRTLRLANDILGRETGGQIRPLICGRNP